ncbi:MAG: dihydropteroate synthase-like protein [Methanoculleaceae archaeon]
MRILLPTGSKAEPVVRRAVRTCGVDAEVRVTGEIAAFLTPGMLRELLRSVKCDMVIVPGMCTASFADVEEESGVPIYRGPRHAADLPLILPHLDEIPLSRTVPADELIMTRRREEAMERLRKIEEGAHGDIILRGVPIGGGSRIKVLAEIMDAHRHPSIREAVEGFFAAGADIVDLGFGFDATPEDVRRVFKLLEDIPGPLALDSQDPVLIHAGLFRADLILSLQEENIPVVGEEVAAAGAAAVVVPGDAGLEANLGAADAAGIGPLIADPLLQPPGSGLVASIKRHTTDYGVPLFFGAGNVTELIDADSIGVNALLCAIAAECNAAVIFTSEHSDKTAGSVGEMRRATEMLAVGRDRPYPKDLGIDLLIIKEKRRRREPPLAYDECIDAPPAPEEIEYDPLGPVRIGIEDGYIVAVHRGRAYRGRSADDLLYALIRDGRVSRLDHAAYLGKELYKAGLALRFGRSYEQDGPF